MVIFEIFNRKIQDSNLLPILKILKKKHISIILFFLMMTNLTSLNQVNAWKNYPIVVVHVI